MQRTTTLLLYGLCVAFAARAERPAGPWVGVSLIHETRGKTRWAFRHDGGALQLLDGKRPVLAYNYGPTLAPGMAEDRRRASYIHPLYGLDGEVLTGDFMTDHPHHRGLFWAWPGVYLIDDVTPAERLDLWHLRGVWSRFEAWLAQETQGGCAVIGVRNGWYTRAQERVAEEQVWLRVWPADKQGRTIDVDLAWTATTMPLDIHGQLGGDKGYGGFSYRAAAGADVALATAAGPVRGDGDGVPAPWVDYSAMFGNRKQRSGVAIFPAPDHPDYPPGFTLRHYGFLGVAWPGLERIRLDPAGPPLRLRYRVYLHRGDAAQGGVAAAHARYLRAYKQAPRDIVR